MPGRDITVHDHSIGYWVQNGLSEAFEDLADFGLEFLQRVTLPRSCNLKSLEQDYSTGFITRVTQNAESDIIEQ